MKKILTMLMMLALAWCMVLSASAAEIVDSGTCGENVTWTLDNAGILTVSGTGVMEQSESLRQISEQVQTAIVSPGITEIGQLAFEKFTNLREVSLPADIVSIGYGAFSGCSRLESVVLPDSITQLAAHTFFECSSLKTIVIPDGVTSLEICSLARCGSLTSVTLPDSLTSIGPFAFSSCTQLAEIRIPDSVTEICHDAFARTKLATVTIPASVTKIEDNGFLDCHKLKTVYFQGDAPQLTGETFDHVIATIYYPQGNPTWTKDIMQHYGGYLKWEPYDAPPKIVASGQCGDNVTWTLDEKGAVVVSGEGDMWDYLYYNSPFHKHTEDITAITIQNGITAIGNWMFVECVNMVELSLPVSVTSIGEFAFHKCYALKRAVIPDSVAYMGAGAFAQCFELAEVTLPASLTSLERAVFYKCGKLSSITIPENVTSIGPSVFSECSILSSVSIADSVTSIGPYAFGNCISLAKVEMGDKVESIGEFAFSKCTSLTQFTLPQTVTSIGTKAFYGCTGLTDIVLPLGYTEIDKNAFASCGLTSITIHADVTVVNDNAFLDCNNLKTIRFLGDAPDMPGEPFDHVIATVYYPIANKTWTKDKMQHYGGYLTWIAECGHSETTINNAKEPTCTVWGYTGDTVCATCGEVLQKSIFLPAKGHSYENGICTVCGEADPDWVPPEPEISRLAGDHRFETAFLAADQMKANLGIEKFDTVVVASGMDFADALSGSYLAAVNNAPILLACQVESINETVKAYIKENLKEGGKIYILGGTNAIPDSFGEGLTDYTLRRLAGTNRFDTNLKILKEAGIGDNPILVCTGLGFADSLSASATKLHILLVYGDKLLTADQAAFLEANRGRPIYIIGGTSAVNTKIEAQLKGYGETKRVAGNDRFQTSVLIAETFFDSPNAAVLAYAWNFPDGLCGGPLAATMNAPLILTMEKYESQAANYIQSRNIQTGITLGGETLIPDNSINLIFGLK